MTAAIFSGGIFFAKNECSLSGESRQMLLPSSLTWRYPFEWTSQYSAILGRLEDVWKLLSNGLGVLGCSVVGWAFHDAQRSIGTTEVGVQGIKAERAPRILDADAHRQNPRFALIGHPLD